jgi:hypothetical protein
MAPMETSQKAVEQAGKQVGVFMRIMEGQPLSLALVLMNLVLMALLFYASSQTLAQRKDIAQMIVTWQQATDNLMASCVSKDIMALVLDALKIAREQGEQRTRVPVPVPLPPPRPPEPPP